MTNYEISLVSEAKCCDGRAYEELYSLYCSKVFAISGYLTSSIEMGAPKALATWYALENGILTMSGR